MFRVHRVWSSLQPQRPRHPFVRAVFGLLAVCALLLLATVGAVIAAIVFVGSVLWRIMRPAASTPCEPHDLPRANGDCIDGEYSVLPKPLHRITNH